MFNMGGPIKEGVMHGIREPYRGGQLVRPGSGRPGYAGPGDINPQAWHKQPLQKIANTTQKIAQETARIRSKLNLLKKSPEFYRRLEKGGSVKKYAGGSTERKPKSY